MFFENFISIFSILFGALGGFCAGYGIEFFIHAAGKKAAIWGQRFTPIPKVDQARIIGIVGWPILIFSMIPGMVNLLQDPWGPYAGENAMKGMLAIGAAGLAGIIAALPGTILGSRHLEKILMNSKNALPLAKLRIMQEVDAHMGAAHAVAIFADGIALFDEKNYCFFTAQYSDYALGVLNDGDQVKLLGYYFRQKYGTQFKYKPKVENKYVGNRVVFADVQSILFVRQNASAR